MHQYFSLQAAACPDPSRSRSLTLERSFSIAWGAAGSCRALLIKTSQYRYLHSFVVFGFRYLWKSHPPVGHASGDNKEAAAAAILAGGNADAHGHDGPPHTPSPRASCSNSSSRFREERELEKYTSDLSPPSSPPAIQDLRLSPALPYRPHR